MSLDLRELSHTVHLRGTRTNPGANVRVYVTYASLLRRNILRQELTPVNVAGKTWATDFPRAPRSFVLILTETLGGNTTVKTFKVRLDARGNLIAEYPV